MANYATVAELKDRLSFTDTERDFALAQCIEGASRWIEKETGRRFYAVAETRYYTAPQYTSYAIPSDSSERPGGGAQGIAIDDLIVPTVDDELVYPTLATDEDGDRVFETTWTYGTDFWLEPFNAAVDGKPYRQIVRNGTSGRFFFPQYRGAISVTGSFGYASTTPGAIRELCLEVAELLARPVLDMTIPGTNTYKLGDELTVTMASQLLTDWAQRVLIDYRDGVFL